MGVVTGDFPNYIKIISQANVMKWQETEPMQWDNNCQFNDTSLAGAQSLLKSIRRWSGAKRGHMQPCNYLHS